MAVQLAMPILIVDDDKTVLGIVRRLLGQIGFKQVDEASDGMTALMKMTEKSYGLVLSDWNMEPMNGFELLKQVRSDPCFASTRFILMTAAPNTENVIAAKKAGASNYIVKPFNAATLKDKIERAFGASD
jgi:two-component system chemotaxis response regulator CheY